MSVTYRRRVRRRTKLERRLAFAAAAPPRTVFFTGVYLLFVVGLAVGLTGSQSSAGLGTGSIAVSSTETQLAVTNTGRRALRGVRVYRLGYGPEDIAELQPGSSWSFPPAGPFPCPVGVTGHSWQEDFPTVWIGFTK